MDNLKPDHGQQSAGRKRVQVNAIWLTVLAAVSAAMTLYYWSRSNGELYRRLDLIFAALMFAGSMAMAVWEWYVWKTYEQSGGKPLSRGGLLAGALYATALLGVAAVSRVLEDNAPAPYVDGRIYVKDPIGIWDIVVFGMLLFQVGSIWRSVFTYNKKKP